MNLGSHSKINSNSNDEAFTRECLGYILRSCFGKLLNENAQLKIVKELTTILNVYFYLFIFSIIQNIFIDLFTHFLIFFFFFPFKFRLIQHHFLIHLKQLLLIHLQ